MAATHLAAGAFRERCLQIIETGSSLRIKTINDAIDTISSSSPKYPELFEGTDVANAIEVTSKLFSSACRYVRVRLSSSSVVEAYEDVGRCNTPINSGACCAHAVRRS